MKLVGAIDQGTTSTRFIVFNELGNSVASHSVPLTVDYPKPGWAQINANFILESVRECLEKTTLQIKKQQLSLDDIVCIGITNQRETTCVWDKITGKPLAPAIS
jgi:glycerol kinase